MKELNDIVQQTITSMNENGTIKKIIEDKVENTVKSIIMEQLREHSEFGNGLKEYVRGALNIDFERLGIAGHNDFILKMVDTLVTNELRTESNERLKKSLKEIISNPPKEINLTEIVRQFKNQFRPEENEEYADQTQMTLICRCDDDYFHYIDMDEKANKQRYQCDYRIGLHKESNTNEWKVFTLNIKDCDIGKNLFMGPFYAMEKLLYQLYCGKSTVIIDVDPDEIDTDYYSGENHE